MSADATDRHPDVVLCPGGPMLLRGEHVVQDEDGQEHRTWRPVSACTTPAAASSRTEMCANSLRRAR